MAERTVEAWCDGAVADYELGSAREVSIYASREDLEVALPYVVGSEDYAPRRLTITIHEREE